jgi:hypothetical protein
MAYLLRALQGDFKEFCGRAVRSTGGVLYVTEETEGRWAERRDELGLTDDNHYLINSFPRKSDRQGWGNFIKYLLEVLAGRPAGLVVLDTLDDVWPVNDENKSTEVNEALKPLRDISTGRGVLLTHHLSKYASGNQGTGSRGSGALPAFVDVIVELNRSDPDDDDDRRRVLAGWSRYDETPAKAVIELATDGTGYTLVGDGQDVADLKASAKAGKQQRLDDADDAVLLAALDKLSPNGEVAGYRKVHAATRLKDGKNLSKDRMSNAFERLLAAGVLSRAPATVEIGQGATTTAKGMLRTHGPT